MSAIQPTIPRWESKFLPIRLERAATAICVVYSTAAISGESHRLGRLDDVSGSGAFSTGLAQDFSLVSIHSSHQNSVLCGLGSGQAQAVVFLLQSADVVCIQRIENSTAVSVLVLNHITGGVLDSVLNGTGIGCALVLHIGDSGSGVAAAISNLTGQTIEAGLHIIAQIADSAIYTIEALQDGGVHAVKSLAQGLLDASLTKSKIIQVGQDSGIVEASGKVSLSSTRCATACTATISTSEAVSAPTCKEEKNNNPNLLP